MPRQVGVDLEVVDGREEAFGDQLVARLGEMDEIARREAQGAIALAA